MTVYIALLRGINVGGKTVIKMADLRETLIAAGFADVQTYIQSGNILLRSDLDEAALHDQLEAVIRDRFGWTLPVILRTAAEWNEIIASMPYTPPELAAAADAAGDAESHYLALLDSIPTPEKLARVSAYCSESEHMRMNGRDVYLLFHMSVRLSKLAQKLDQLSGVVTIRNWNTVCKLAELAGEMG